MSPEEMKHYGLGGDGGLWVAYDMNRRGEDREGL